MPRRTYIFANDEYYHVYNRSIGKEQIFVSKRDLDRAIDLLDYYRKPQRMRYSYFRKLTLDTRASYIHYNNRQSPLIDVISFAFMPNHYHLLIKQKITSGITNFISNFQNSFAKYYNLKNNRSGGLFQNSFKAKRVETDEEFLHVSRYIHLNPVTNFVLSFKGLKSYSWTSFNWIVNPERNRFIVSDDLIGQFQSRKSYIQFVADQEDYQRKLEIIKHLVLEY